jgi:hypothetical protein
VCAKAVHRSCTVSRVVAGFLMDGRDRKVVGDLCGKEDKRLCDAFDARGAMAIDGWSEADSPPSRSARGGNGTVRSGTSYPVPCLVLLAGGWLILISSSDHGPAVEGATKMDVSPPFPSSIPIGHAAACPRIGAHVHATPRPRARCLVDPGLVNKSTSPECDRKNLIGDGNRWETQT